MKAHGSTRKDLGQYSVKKNGISTNTDKINVIANLPHPINAKGYQCFMGHCGH